MIIISEKEAKGKACPFVIGACEGKNCMAWIPLDDGVGNCIFVALAHRLVNPTAHAYEGPAADSVPADN